MDWVKYVFVKRGFCSSLTDIKEKSIEGAKCRTVIIKSMNKSRKTSCFRNLRFTNPCFTKLVQSFKLIGPCD